MKFNLPTEVVEAKEASLCSASEPIIINNEFLCFVDELIFVMYYAEYKELIIERIKRDMEISDHDTLSTGIHNLMKKGLIPNDALKFQSYLEGSINYYLTKVVDEKNDELDDAYLERIGIWRNTKEHVDYLREMHKKYDTR